MTAPPIEHDHTGDPEHDPVRAADVAAGLDPDRPFRRMERGVHDLLIEPEDEPQWCRDWLDWVGITAEELLRRHDEHDFHGGKDRYIWGLVGDLLEEGVRVQTLRSRT